MKAHVNLSSLILIPDENDEIMKIAIQNTVFNFSYLQSVVNKQLNNQSIINQSTNEPTEARTNLTNNRSMDWAIRIFHSGLSHSYLEVNVRNTKSNLGDKQKTNNTSASS